MVSALDVLRQGNVISAIAQGKTTAEIKKIAEANKVNLNDIKQVSTGTTTNPKINTNPITGKTYSGGSRTGSSSSSRGSSSSNSRIRSSSSLRISQPKNPIYRQKNPFTPTKYNKKAKGNRYGLRNKVIFGFFGGKTKTEKVRFI